MTWTSNDVNVLIDLCYNPNTDARFKNHIDTSQNIWNDITASFNRGRDPAHHRITTSLIEKHGAQHRRSNTWPLSPPDEDQAPGHTSPKLRGAHARNSAQGVLMRRQTWRTPDITAPPRPMVRNAPSGARAPPAWRRGTNF